MLRRLKQWMSRKDTLLDDPIKNTLIGQLLVVTDHHNQTTASTINYVSKTYLKDRDLTVYRLYTNWNNYAELYYRDKTFLVGTVVFGDPTQSTSLMTFTQTLKEMGGFIIDSICYNSFHDTTCLDTTEHIWKDATPGASYTNTRFKDWTYCIDTTNNYTVVTQDNTRFSVLTVGHVLFVGYDDLRFVKNLDTNITEVRMTSDSPRIDNSKRSISGLIAVLRVIANKTHT